MAGTIKINVRPLKPLTTTHCVKVTALRQASNDASMTLERWLQLPNNIYVGRPGKLYIGTGESKRVFYYPGSKFCNPFKSGDNPHQDVLMLYTQHLHTSGLILQLEELRGKNLGCFCDQSQPCHAKILAGYLNSNR